MPGWQRALFDLNNTLLGRMVLGPALSLFRFWKSDNSAILAGNRAVIRAWLLHLVGLAGVVAFLSALSTVSITGYLLSAYAGMSLLMIRTYLEHRAHDDVGARTVLIEDKGPLALLFLNNNLHAVHHAHPAAPWYRLPALYRTDRATYQHGNCGYFYRSYGEIFSRYTFRRKEPVAHPLHARS